MRNRKAIKKLYHSRHRESQLKILPTGHIDHTHGGLEVLSPGMQALKAEIFETLHKVEYYHSFSSAKKDRE